MGNKTVLITGVGKRIGLALAQHLIAEGYDVIGTYRTRYDSIEALQAAGADLYCVDFYDDTQLSAFIATIQATYPSLRAIVHNASDWLPEGQAAPADTLAKMMQIHVGVPYQINLALQALLTAHDGTADIVHLSDYVAEKGSKKHIAYAASKAALNNLTLSFAAQLAPKVKVNAVAPAMIMFNPDDDEQYRAKTLKKSLMEIEPGAQEVVEAITYLLNSQYVTGRVLPVDGGRHLK